MKRKEDIKEIIARYIVDEQDNNKEDMINKYIGDDEESRQEFEEYIALWEKSANIKDFDSIDTDKDWLKVRSRLHLKPRNRKIPLSTYFLRIAAILILAIGLSYILSKVMEVSLSSSTEYYEFSYTESNSELELSDGTLIHLNKGSKIIQNSAYGDDNRDIILEGEAFFKVAPNKDLPFKVHTMNTVVEVLGTSFNVKSNTSEVIVGVLTGKVAMYSPSNKEELIELLPDNTGIYNTDTKQFKFSDNLDINTLAWHTGNFSFDGKPLIEVVEILAKYYDLELVIHENLEISEQIIGDFSAQSLQNAVLDLNTIVTADIEIIPRQNKLIVRRNP